MSPLHHHDVSANGAVNQSRPEDQRAKGPWWFGGFWAMLRQRCPRCRKGKMFRGPFTMNDPCPVCGLLFQREEGYFLGAMYVSYLLGILILVPSYFLFAWLLPTWDGILVSLVAIVPYLPLMPLVFRYSRVIWVHVERLVDSVGGINAGPYEKFRLWQIEKARAEQAVRKENDGKGPASPGD